jgi:hypothetical protein
VIIFLWSFLSSCSNQLADEKISGPDFSDYFQNELVSLKKTDSLKLSKMVTLNLVTEQTTISTIDWDLELGTFTKLKIGPTEWKNNFRLDSSSFYQPNQQTLHFSSKDVRSDIYRVDVSDTFGVVPRSIDQFKLSWPSRMIFYRRSSNLISETSQILTYMPGRGYVVSGTQKTRTLPKSSYRIQGIWHKASWPAPSLF